MNIAQDVVMHIIVSLLFASPDVSTKVIYENLVFRILFMSADLSVS